MFDRKNPNSRSTRCTAFIASIIALAQFFLFAAAASAAEEWTVESVIAAVEARSKAITSIDATFERAMSRGRDWVEFENDLELYNQRIARFYRFSREARLPMTNVPTRRPRESEWLRLRTAQSGEMKLEFLEGPPSDSKEKSNVTRSWTYREDVWEQHAPNPARRGASVILDNVATLPPLPQALGLGSPLSPTTRLMLLTAKGRPLSLADFLRGAQRDGMVEAPKIVPGSGEKPLVELKVKKRLDKSIDKVEFFAEVTIHFQPAYGMAPVSVGTTELHLRDGKLVGVPMPMGFDAEWSDFAEVSQVSGLWVPHRLTVRDYATIIKPKIGEDFQPRLVNGEPTYWNGVQDIDVEQTTIRKYERSVTEFKVAKIEVNGKLDDGLFATVYPEGTVVEDRRSNDIYELNTAGSALTTTDRTMLDGPSVYPTSAAPTKLPQIDEPSFPLTTIIAVIFGVLVVLTFLLFRRRARGSNQA